ncbi:hypothetical protein Sjap_017198 [Stephania japonica]|uniref:Uncharacterized protein n=1 Tax=Stephania japonica TaxID=461633 RepID=A0AAP0I5Q7_9MAGN
MDVKRLLTDLTTEVSKRYGFSEIALAWGVDEDLKKLQSTWVTINSVISYAEDQRVQDNKERLWLKRLKSIVIVVEDILDEVSYDTRQLEIEGNANTDQNIFRNAISNISSSVNSMSSTFTLAHRVKHVKQMLGDIAKEKDDFNLKGGMHRITASDHHNSGLDRDTSPFFDYSKVVGRQDEILTVTKMLRHDSNDVEENFSVIPIVGFGGLGKTTLAQLVCSFEKEIKHFDPIEWICVANDSCHGTLLSNVFQGICNNSVKLPDKTQMQKSLMEKLRGKRFLIILDDVWNTEQWEDVRVVLTYGAKGSSVLVTTRKEGVAETMGTVSPYPMKRLPETYCRAIFKERAFQKGGPPKTPAFEEIGEQIVAKCGGFPLAVKTLGALMHSKKTIAEWMSIRDIEDLLVRDEAGLMRVLRLNYDHLASPLKKCFKYCAVFPKGSRIMKDDLIRQWIAQGFIPPSSDDHFEMEEVGNDYFQHLRWNSLFQEVEEDKINGALSCKMHDIVRKLALSVAEKECFVVDSLIDATKNTDIGGTLHFRTDLYNKEENLSILKNLSTSGAKLRTFTSSIATWASDGWLQFRWIRVLRLEKVGDLPPSIGDMKLLRYLFIGSWKIQVLPKSISQLYLLETLDVHLCFVLKELPEDMWKLIGLRHLLLPSHRVKMPKKFGGLHRLQTILPILYLGEEEDGCGISELEHLNQIRGNLIICNLDDVRSAIHAKKAKLDMKEKITHLAMKWNNKKEDDGSENNDSAEAAEALDVPPNLLELSMQQFPGVKLPITTWSLGFLLHIKLEKCYVLEEFPPTTLNLLQTLYVQDCPKLKLALASFASLKKIFISNIHSVVVQVAMEECSSSTAIHHYCYLPSLISLIIEHVPEFIALPKGFLQRSEHLRLVSIKHCDKFRGFHGEKGLLVTRPSNLKTVTLMSCSSVEYVDVRGMTSLEMLEILSCRNASVIAAQLPSLKYLRLHLLQSFVMEPVANVDDTSFITSLSIVEVKDFTTFPQGLLRSYTNCTNYLRWLHIEGCPKFQGFSQDELQVLASLERLHIIKCPSLTSLVVSRSVSLRELTVMDCIGIKSFQLPEEAPESLPLLHTLEIGGFSAECDYLSFPAIQGNNSPWCSSLKNLTIWGRSNVSSLPHQLQYLTALESLQIKCYDALIALPEWLGNLSSLCKLAIYDCRALMDFPSSQQMQRLTSLISVRIKNCPLLSRTLKSDDQEWLKIRDCDIDHDEDTSRTTITLYFGIPVSFIQKLEEGGSSDIKQLFLQTSLYEIVEGNNGSQ